tara:strand:+ start:50 stop:430 length:381 start_codon:yes stop_codon:yes gene_type:complete
MSLYHIRTAYILYSFLSFFFSFFFFFFSFLQHDDVVPLEKSRNAAHRGSVAFTKASGTSRASRQWGKARGLLRLRALRDEARRQSSTAAYPERTKEEERALLAEGAALRRKMGRWHGVNGNGTVVE